jgi:hypothetical protein
MGQLMMTKKASSSLNCPTYVLKMTYHLFWVVILVFSDLVMKKTKSSRIIGL